MLKCRLKIWMRNSEVQSEAQSAGGLRERGLVHGTWEYKYGLEGFRIANMPQHHFSFLLSEVDIIF